MALLQKITSFLKRNKIEAKKAALRKRIHAERCEVRVSWNEGQGRSVAAINQIRDMARSHFGEAVIFENFEQKSPKGGEFYFNIAHKKERFFYDKGDTIEAFKKSVLSVLGVSKIQIDVNPHQNTHASTIYRHYSLQ